MGLPLPQRSGRGEDVSIDFSNLQFGNARLWQEDGRHDTWRLVHDSGRIVARVRRTLDGEYETGGVFYASLEAAKKAAEKQP